MNQTLPATTARPVRGNAMLIQLDCRTALEPAHARHPELDYLIPALEQVRQLQSGAAMSTDPAAYNVLAITLANALSSARAAWAAQDDGPGAPPHRTMIQLLAKCETRARRVVLLQETPPQTDS